MTKAETHRVEGPTPGPYAHDIVRLIKKDWANKGFKYIRTESNEYDRYESPWLIFEPNPEAKYRYPRND